MGRGRAPKAYIPHEDPRQAEIQREKDRALAFRSWRMPVVLVSPEEQLRRDEVRRAEAAAYHAEVEAQRLKKEQEEAAKSAKLHAFSTKERELHASLTQVGTVVNKHPSCRSAYVALIHVDDDWSKSVASAYVLLRTNAWDINKSIDAVPLAYIGGEAGRWGLKGFLSHASLAKREELIKQRDAEDDAAYKAWHDGSNDEKYNTVCPHRRFQVPAAASVKVIKVAESKRAVTVEVLEWDWN
jgi:hypothetical protein